MGQHEKRARTHEGHEGLLELNDKLENRAGGDLCIQLYNATADEQLADTDVIVSVDGLRRTFTAGGILRLKPGESLTLPTRVFHKFWAEGSRVMMGEVSMINDDQNDNCF